MGVVLAVLSRIWPYVLCAALALGAYIYAQKACWNDACHSQRDRADKLQAQADQAKQRATDLALLYARTLDASEKATHDALTEQAEKFAAIKEAASHLSPLPSIVISGDALRVFDSASALANAAPAPSVNQDAPAAISESALAEKWAEAAAAYASAREKWASCVDTYEKLRSAQ